jgi:hypothetical protein
MEGKHGNVDWDSFDDKDELISLSEYDFEDDASVGWVDSESSSSSSSLSSSSSSSSSSEDDDNEWEKRRKRLCLALVAYHILKKKGMKKKRREQTKTTPTAAKDRPDTGSHRTERKPPKSMKIDQRGNQT